MGLFLSGLTCPICEMGLNHGDVLSQAVWDMGPGAAGPPFGGELFCVRKDSTRVSWSLCCVARL